MQIKGGSTLSVNIIYLRKYSIYLHKQAIYLRKHALFGKHMLVYINECYIYVNKCLFTLKVDLPSGHNTKSLTLNVRLITLTLVVYHNVDNLVTKFYIV